MANTEGVIVQSVARAIEIIQLFAEEKELGISEISKKMDRSKSTVYGLVNTLVTYGYLEQVPETKKYKLGMKIFELGCVVEKRLDLRSEARFFCEDISKRYNHTVHLATHFEGEVIYIEKFDRPNFLITYSQVGKRAPMSCTGVGKAMLAFLPEEYVVEHVVKKEFYLKTTKSIKNEKELYESLDIIREKGFAVDYEEVEIGIRCVAAPVFNHKGEPFAAISLSGMANKMTDEYIEKISQEVKECAMNISYQLGYNRW